jgi:hypothetical protein
MHFCFIFEMFAFQSVHSCHFHVIFHFIFDIIIICLLQIIKNEEFWLKDTP